MDVKIILNGKKAEIADCLKLNEFISGLCKNTLHVIAELNGQIIKNRQWDKTVLKNNDIVELVEFVGGG